MRKREKLTGVRRRTFSRMLNDHGPGSEFEVRAIERLCKAIAAAESAIFYVQPLGWVLIQP